MEMEYIYPQNQVILCGFPETHSNVRAHHVQCRLINNTNTRVELDTCHRLRHSFRSVSLASLILLGRKRGSEWDWYRMEKPSWVPTLVAQACLCFSLYLAFQLGQPQKPMYHGTSGTRPLDLYFISVGGGFRPLNQQTHLLKQVSFFKS